MRIVILAAGIGSRFGSEYNKCSVGLDKGNNESSLSRLINQLNNYLSHPEIFIVTGYSMNSVVSRVNRSVDDTSNIYYIYNPYFNVHGCNYSLSCAQFVFNGSDDVLIVEADNVFSNNVVKEFIDEINKNSDYHDLCLARDRKFISSRSVAIKRTGSLVSEFIYDTDHKDDYGKSNSDLLDSMQMFFIRRVSSNLLGMLLKFYRNSKPGTTKCDSGIYSINTLTGPSNSMKYVLSSYQEEWVNINTKDDLDKARKMIERSLQS